MLLTISYHTLTGYHSKSQKLTTYWGYCEVKDMRVLLLFVLQLCGCVYTLRGYHEDVGIPKARRLMILEMAPRIIGGRAVSAISQYPYQVHCYLNVANTYIHMCKTLKFKQTKTQINNNNLTYRSHISSLFRDHL